jgi:hypothetical protein
MDLRPLRKRKEELIDQIAEKYGTELSKVLKRAKIAEINHLDYLIERALKWPQRILGSQPKLKQRGAWNFESDDDDDVKVALEKKTEEFTANNKETTEELRMRSEQVSKEMKQLQKVLKEHRSEEYTRREEDDSKEAVLKEQIHLLKEELVKIRWEKAGLTMEEEEGNMLDYYISFSFCDVCSLVNGAKAKCDLRSGEVVLSMRMCDKCRMQNKNKMIETYDQID